MYAQDCIITYVKQYVRIKSYKLYIYIYEDPQVLEFGKCCPDPTWWIIHIEHRRPALLDTQL